MLVGNRYERVPLRGLQDLCHIMVALYDFPISRIFLNNLRVDHDAWLLQC